MAQLQTKSMYTKQSAVTTSGTQANFWMIPGGGAAVGADFLLNVSAASGTNPTLIVTIQKGWLDVGTSDTSDTGDQTTGSMNWIDQWSFAQQTGTTSIPIQLCLGTTGNSQNAGTQNTMSANTQHAGRLGQFFRVAHQIGGTNTPTFTYTVVAVFDF